MSLAWELSLETKTAKTAFHRIRYLCNISCIKPQTQELYCLVTWFPCKHTCEDKNNRDVLQECNNKLNS